MCDTMCDDFADLELLAQQPLDFDIERILAEAAPAYRNAAIHELFDLLESSVESYTLVRAQLAMALRESAEAEIEFFLKLLQERLNALLEPAKNKSLQLQIQSV
jgi:hypothetical protein